MSLSALATRLFNDAEGAKHLLLMGLPSQAHIVIRDIIEYGPAVVFFSHDLNFIETFSNMKILIKGGTLTKVPKNNHGTRL